MERMDFREKWVLVTGASSGLGEELARQLARDHKANLVVVARREDKLRELKDELESRHGVKVEPVAADLSKLDQVDRALAEATHGRELYGAVLNAGVSHFGPFEELEWSRFETMLATNVTAVVRMATHLVPHLEQHRDGGGLMIVASMAGVTPVPYQTAYSGTKAFLMNFGAGLHHEVAHRNVSVTTFAPGGIITEMTAGERFGPLRSWLMPVDRCARHGIDAMASRRYTHFPGISNRVGSILAGILPRRFMTGRVAATYRSAIAKAGHGRRSEEDGAAGSSAPAR
jgi:short-subunit dehydrogenase